MNHPAPASFPDPMRRIGTPVTPPHGTQPNPAYQDLLTLYAKVYGAEESLAHALHPARRTARDPKTWTGHAGQEWTSDLEAWNRRLAHAAERIVAELAERLRATPPCIVVGTEPMQPADPNPGGPLRTRPDPGGPDGA
ncbi:MAG TPA: hypothetical protein VGL63_01655 [Streptosporangiaceae bacterium]